MTNNTRKILKELSDLTSNMDVLARELKDSVKSNKEIAENVGNLTDNIEKDRAESNKPKVKPEGNREEKLFNNLTKSFEKVMSESNKGIKDMLSKTMESAIPTGIAKVKADPKFSEVLENSDIKDFINKAAKSIPGLEEGGEIVESGVAIVGEGGPELVELERGDKVKTIEQQMFDRELVDVNKAKEDQNKTVQESWDKTLAEKDNLVTDEPTLATKDKNGPSENEINIERERLIKDDPSLKDDPDQLKDDINSYIEEYDRETFVQEDVPKLSEPVNKNIETAESTESKESTDGVVTDKKQKDGFLSKLAKKSKELFDGIKVDTKNVKAEAINPEMSMLASSYMDDGGFSSNRKKLEGSKPIQKLKTKVIDSPNIEADEKPKTNREVNKQDLKSETSTLKSVKPTIKEKAQPESGSELDKNPDVLKDAKKKKAEDNKENEQETPKSSVTTPYVANNSGEPSTTKEPRKSKKKPQTPEPVNPITAKDLQDIKMLLVSINRSLTSPLNIASDQPYRPETNNF